MTRHSRIPAWTSLALWTLLTFVGGGTAGAAVVPNTGTGLRADYFSDQNMTTLVASRTDAAVNFNWTAAPVAGVTFASGFSVRWTGVVRAQYSEQYTFYTNTSTGVKLWVSGQVLDKWGSHNAEEDTGQINLIAGNSYFIRMEYYYNGNSNGGTALAQLKWYSSSTPKDLIPQTSLSPAASGGGWSPMWTNWNNFPSVTTAWAAQVSPANALPEYPRPQMARTNWLNLNGLWQFNDTGVTNLNTPPIGQTLTGKILVPYPIQSSLSGVAHNTAQQYAWYRQLITVPPGWSGQHVLLHFEGVCWQSKVYVNGTLLGTHSGSYDYFTYDITSALTGSGPQEVIVGIYDPAENGGEPHGKGYHGPPYKYFYTAYSGIWQTVWIEPVPASSIGKVVVVPDVDNHCVRVTVNVDGPATGLTVQANASFAAVACGTVSGSPGVSLTLPLSMPNKLWSPNAPNLYDLTVTLKNGGTTVDTVTSYFGLRKMSVGTWTDGKTRILLNNEFVFIIGMLDQGYWPDGICTPPTEDAILYDIQTTKAMGFNMLRKHMKVESERWYYWADKLGLIVFQDMPQAGEYSQALDQTEFPIELQAMVQGRINHPCIGMWTIFNEGWGQYNTAQLTTQVQVWDPSRLVDSASGWNDAGTGSVIDGHDYSANPNVPTPTATRAAVLGEFGGWGLVDGKHSWSGSSGYGSASNGAALANDYVTQVTNVPNGLVTKMANPGISSATFTGTSDIENESIGLMYYDRDLKFDAAGVSAILAANVQLAAAAPPPPVITSGTTATGAQGQVFNYQITATHNPDSYNATGLPAGLSVNASGLISGTPTGSGTTTASISATNTAGTGTANLAITITAPPTQPPVITSATTATGTATLAFSYQITATNSPISYNATGLPAGLTVNTATGLITGTPTGGSVTSVTISATNLIGTGNATLTLTINAKPPKTWTGLVNSNWSNGGNWTGGVAPIAGDDLILTFAGTRPTNQDIAGLSLNTLTFNSTITDSFTVSGQAVTLTGTGTTLTVDVAPMSLNYTNDIAINFPIILGSRQTWKVTAGTWDPNVAHVPTTIFTMSGVVSDGGNHYGLIKDGDGTVWLTANNTFSGVTTILKGLIVISNDNNLGIAPAVPTPGSIELNGGELRAQSGLTLNPNRGIALGPTSGSGRGYLSCHYDQQLIYTGIIADNGAGIGGLVQMPVGTIPPFTQGEILLGGPNTYSGDTRVQSGNDFHPVTGVGGGSFNLGAANVIPHGPGKGNVIVDIYAYLDLKSFDATINGLSGAGWIQTTGPHTLTVGDNNATSTFSGIMQNGNGSLSLTKIGTGTLTLSGVNNNSGATTVTAGTLLVTGTIGGSGVTVNGGTLGGTGAINCAITIPATKAGTIAPGIPGSTGILHVNNPVTFGDANATFAVELKGTTVGTGYDQLAVNSSVTLNGCVLNASLGGGYAPAVGDVLTIITANSAIGGNFNGLIEGASVAVSGYTCKVSYLSNKVTLSQFAPGSGAAKLAFSQQPTNTTAGQNITPTLTVLVQDAGGATMNSTAPVTLAILANPGSGTLGGTTTVFAASGVATFSGLSIDRAGAGYTLSASSPGLTAAASGTFTIIPAVPTTPVITSATTASGTVGSAFNYQITASNSPASYNATGLPAGLAVNTATGVISGTPTGASTTGVTISATNAGGTGSANLSITINPAPTTPPVITSAATASGTVNQAFTFQITASNSPTSFNATGLPTGLAVNTSTGAITGTPTGASTSTVTISATNAGGTGTATLTITINPASPAITSATTASGTTGTAFTYTITATNSPTSYNATNLPAGLSVNTGTGVITGTPTGAGTTGTISATNAAGTGSAALTITIAAPPTNPPVINSALTASGSVGSAFSYQITASNSPTSYNATGLPAGLAVNTLTGVISGIPTGTGTPTVTISATNAIGTGSASLALTVLSAGGLPAPWQDQDIGAVGSAGSASYAGTTFTVKGSGADIWNSVDAFNFVSQPLSGDGTIVARVASQGNTDGWAKAGVMIRESMNVGSAMAMMALTPTNGAALQYRTTTDGACNSNPVAGVAPAWVKLVRAGTTFTGYVSTDGTNWTSAGSTTITMAANVSIGLAVTAHNNTVLNTSTFDQVTVTAAGAPPAITSATTATGTVGAAFSYAITASNAPTSFTATGLPNGLAVNTGTGAITGTPTGAGTASVTISATNAGGTGSATLTLTVNPATPVISSATNATGKVGQAFSYTITASNAPTSYNATGLPAGLAVNTGTGAITGTPTGAGTASVTISATNAGGTGSTTLTLTVNPATPVITGATMASGAVNQAFSYQITATNSPTSFDATGLPNGLAVNTGTGAITGTPTAGGTTIVTLNATNAGGTGSATLTVAITALPTAPVITGATTATGTVGVAFTYQIVAANSPENYNAAPLPDGLAINTSTGAITGTPTAAGATTVTLSATNAGGTGSATLTVTVAMPPTPVITSATTASGTVGGAFSYTITASNSPTSYGAMGLPAGLAVNTGTGAITGTPTGAGTTSVSLSATNAGGTGTTTLLSVTILPAGGLPPPWLDQDIGTVGSAGSASYAGTTFTVKGSGADMWDATDAFNFVYQALNGNGAIVAHVVSQGNTDPWAKAGVIIRNTLTANSADALMMLTPGNGTAFQYRNAAGAGYNTSAGPTVTAPYWLKLARLGNTFTGYTSTDGNTWTQAGSTTITMAANVSIGLAVCAHNNGAISTSTFDNVSVTTANPPLPAITSAITASGMVGAAFTYQITASNGPGSYNATGLPAGLAVNTGTGTITGTPTGTGTATVTISATNAGGTGTAILTLTVNPAMPVITSVTTATGKVGVAFSYTITASNSPASFNAAPLPAGLAVNTGTGAITGTPTTAGTTTVTISATNAGGTGTAALTLTINPATPVITSATTASGADGKAFSYQITASNSPTSYQATGLPAGLAVNTGTGAITGTPIGTSTTTVTLSATNAGGTGTAILTVTIAASPTMPVITSATTASGAVNQAFTYQIVAANSPTGYDATGLPEGLAINTGTGAITGTPTGTSTTTVTLSATNAGGTGTATLTVTIAALTAGPVITATTASGTVNQAFTYQIAATNSPTGYDAMPLPEGLAINTGTGAITGTPTAIGTTSVTLSATNAGGTGSATLTVIITALPTVVAPASGPAAPVAGTPAQFSVLGGPAAIESSLIYTWSVVSGPAGGTATFSPNGTNAAKNPLATFTSAGTYQVQVAIYNPVNGTSTTSGPVSVAVSAAPAAPSSGKSRHCGLGTGFSIFLLFGFGFLCLVSTRRR
jgi:regulation of enolase protein 1 (concanavalin A-like superfamily)